MPVEIIKIDLRDRHVPQHRLLPGSRGHLHLLPARPGDLHLQPVNRGHLLGLNPDQWDHLPPDQGDHPVLREAEGEAEDGSCSVLLNRNIRNTHFSYAQILTISFFKQAHIIT